MSAKILFIGASSNTQRRVQHHLMGNVEGSVLRKNLATEFGYDLNETYRPRGSKKIELRSKDKEQHITTYIKSGTWKYVECANKKEALELRSYILRVINPKPVLNIDKGKWDLKKEDRYKVLMGQLIDLDEIPSHLIEKIPSIPGVHLFLHECAPKDYEGK